MIPIVVASRRKRPENRGSLFRCGWCSHRGWTYRVLIEARKWRLCGDCNDIFGEQS